jgi:hypothetical protein
MHSQRFALIGAFSAFALSAAPIARQHPPASHPTPRELLRTIAAVTDREWAAVERGEAVAKILPTDSREVAVAGAVRIAAARDQLFERYRDVESLKRSAIVLDIGRFGASPRASDLQSLSFDDHNLDLRDCRPGDCRVRLGADDIGRFHREVNWNDPSWRSQSAALWREVLSGYAAAYRREGRTALPVYANKREPLGVVSELSLLVKTYAFVRSYSPEFHEYLDAFGPAASNHMEHCLYWSREDYGIRPVTRISHQVIARGTGGSAVGLVATNQVYADHYLDAALSVTLAIDAGPGDDGEAFYMIAVSRARTRSLSGLLRAMVRSTVQNRSRNALRKALTATKAALEKTERE